MATRLSFPQGDTVVERLTVTNTDGTPLNLSYYALTFTIKRSPQDTDVSAVWQGTLAGSDIALVGPAAAGVVDVTVPATATELLRTGRLYFWDLQLTDGGIKFSPCGGTILTTTEVTDG